MIRYIRFFLLVLLVLLLNFSYHPTIVSLTAMTDRTAGTILTPYLNLIFMITAAVSLVPVNNSVFRSKVFTTSVKIIFLILFATLLLTVLFKKSMIHEVRVVGMSLAAIIIGWSISEKEWVMKVVLLLFSFTALVIGFLQIQSNIGGFTIELGYAAFAKNQLGVVLATAVIIMMGFFVSHDGKKVFRWIYLIATILGLFFLLTIRARLDTIATVVLIVYMLYLVEKKRSIFVTSFIVLVIIAILILVLPESVSQYITNSFTMGYEGGDITSDRLRRNEFTIQFLLNHPIEGNLFEELDADWVHNYLLNKAFMYGLLFGMPLFIMYFYLGWSVLKRSFLSDVKDLRNIGYYAMLITFIASLGEPTYPFGPGTATTMNFVLFGMSLRNTYNLCECDSVEDLVIDEGQPFI